MTATTSIELLAPLPTVALFAALSALGALGGCGDGGPPNPAPLPSGAGAGGSIPAVVPGPQARRLEERNPWGGPPGNLLVDGDFEHSISFEYPEYLESSLGWVAFASSQVGFRGETGGLCKSGIRCAVMLPEVVLFGRGTAAAAGRAMVASAWAKPPPTRRCDVVGVRVIDCAFTGLGTKVPPVSMDADADGWCQYRGPAPGRDTAACMYIDNTLARGEQALLDAVVLAPDDGTVAPRSLETMSPAMRERIARVSRWVRDHTPLGDVSSNGPVLGTK